MFDNTEQQQDKENIIARWYSLPSEMGLLFAKLMTVFGDRGKLSYAI